MAELEQIADLDRGEWVDRGFRRTGLVYCLDPKCLTCDGEISLRVARADLCAVEGHHLMDPGICIRCGQMMTARNDGNVCDD